MIKREGRGGRERKRQRGRERKREKERERAIEIEREQLASTCILKFKPFTIN